ncbi:MAG: phosphohistidine phosphatase SixA [Glaciecola sp.]|jgi:phosphohistidine phosphatase
MKIFVMRHGEAQLVAESDKQRALTLVGQQQATAAATWLQAQYLLDKPVDLALVSPYIRTQQTFAQVNKVIDCAVTETSQDITPSGVVTCAHDYLSTLLEIKPSIEHVLVVSHMPFVSYFVDALCNTEHTPLFATGAIAVIDYDRHSHTGQILTHYQG